VPGRAAPIGLVHGDVHPGVADRLARGAKPRAVAQLGQDRDRGQLPDLVVTHQRPAARLTARVRAQLPVQGGDPRLDRVDHRQRDRDLLARGVRQRLSGQPLAPVTDHQLAALHAAVVIQRRLDPLLVLRALLRKRVAQPHPGAQIQDVIGRDPRLRQPLEHQQLTQMPRVGAIALRALPRSPQPGSLRRLCEMHAGADPAQLLDHESPAGRRLQRDLQPPAAEALEEPPHPGTVRRRHAPAPHLAGLGIDPLTGDLRSMLIKSHYDAHQGPPQAPRFQRLRGHAPRLS